MEATRRPLTQCFFAQKSFIRCVLLWAKQCPEMLGSAEMTYVVLSERAGPGLRRKA